MTITITINCDNAAFGDSVHTQGEELARILDKLARTCAGGFGRADLDGLNLRDINGNTVGRVEVKE